MQPITTASTAPMVNSRERCASALYQRRYRFSCAVRPANGTCGATRFHVASSRSSIAFGSPVKRTVAKAEGMWLDRKT